MIKILAYLERTFGLYQNLMECYNRQKGAIRVIAETKKISKNEKCPCGSGKSIRNAVWEKT